MNLISAGEEQELVRDVIVATLEGALRTRGSAEQLAGRAQISPVFLSYVRNRVRMFALPTARRVSLALPLEAQQQRDWLEQVVHFHDLGAATRHVVRGLTPDQLRDVVVQAGTAHHRATFAPTPAVAARQFRVAVSMAERVHASAIGRQYPALFAEACLVLHDSYSALNRHALALLVGKQARFVLQHATPVDFDGDRTLLDKHLMNATRSEAVSLHNLGQDVAALVVYEEALTLPAMRLQPTEWIPHLARDRIGALAGTSRFSIREARDIAQQAWDACQKRGDANGALLSFLASRAMANAFLRRGNLKQANRLVTSMALQLDDVSNLGVLHRVMFFRTAAEVRAAIGDGAGTAHWRDTAIEMAKAGGLHHQLAQLQRIGAATMQI